VKTWFQTFAIKEFTLYHYIVGVCRRRLDAWSDGHPVAACDHAMVMQGGAVVQAESSPVDTHNLRNRLVSTTTLE
jgi:hypothetical protein